MLLRTTSCQLTSLPLLCVWGRGVMGFGWFRGLFLYWAPLWGAQGGSLSVWAPVPLPSPSATHTNTHSVSLRFLRRVITVPIIIHACQSCSHADWDLDTHTRTLHLIHALQLNFELMLMDHQGYLHTPHAFLVSHTTTYIKLIFLFYPRSRKSSPTFPLRVNYSL